MLGLAKYQHNLSLEKKFLSILQNVEKQNKPPFLIIKLGGKNPYIKFGEVSSFDEYYFHTLLEKVSPININNQKVKNSINQKTELKEQLLWITLYEEGMFVLPLRHIKFIYKNKEGKIIKWNYAVSECIKYGCRTTLDTKSYYIYGPSSQMTKINTLKRNIAYDPLISIYHAGENELKELPKILFVAAGKDILFDQGKAFCKKVTGLGVKVERHEFSESCHLFITVKGQPTAFNKSVELTKQFLCK